MQKKILIAIVLGALALTGMAVLLLRKTPTGSIAGSAEPLPYLDKFEVANYDFNIRSFHVAENQVQTNLFNFDGSLTLYKQKANEIVCRWKNIRELEIGSEKVSSDVKDLLLNKNFIATQGGTGLQIAADPEVPEELEPSQAYFMSVINLPFAQLIPGTSIRVETDGSTKYDVRYTVVKNPQGFAVTRTWMKTKGSPYDVDPALNSFIYDFDLSGRLIQMKGELAFLRRGALDKIQTIASLSLATDQTPASEIKHVDRSLLTALSEVSGRDETAGIRKSQADLFTELQTFGTASSAKEDQALFAQLSADLHQNPDHLKPLLENILKIESRDDNAKSRMSLLFTVLADSDTPEGANALSQMAATDCPDTFCKSQALMAHTFHTTPTKDSAEKILSVARTSPEQEIYSTAYLSTGAAGQKLVASYPELTSELLLDYSEAADANHKRAIVGAMGNHGQIEYLPTIVENQYAADQYVRASSIYAFRNIQSDRVTPALLDGFEKEKDQSVINSYMRSFDHRTLDDKGWLRMVDRALKWEGDDALQQSVAVMLANIYSLDEGDTRQALDHLRASTQSEKVKVVIQEELAKAEDARARQRADSESIQAVDP